MHASCCCYMSQSTPGRCLALSVHCLLMAGVQMADEAIDQAGCGTARVRALLGVLRKVVGSMFWWF
jgi:hypothetical protein